MQIRLDNEEDQVLFNSLISAMMAAGQVRNKPAIDLLTQNVVDGFGNRLTMVVDGPRVEWITTKEKDKREKEAAQAKAKAGKEKKK